jgi:hypothetical protein
MSISANRGFWSLASDKAAAAEPAVPTTSKPESLKAPVARSQGEHRLRQSGGERAEGRLEHRRTPLSNLCLVTVYRIASSQSMNEAPMSADLARSHIFLFRSNVAMRFAHLTIDPRRGHSGSMQRGCLAYNYRDEAKHGQPTHAGNQQLGLRVRGQPYRT